MNHETLIVKCSTADMASLMITSNSLKTKPVKMAGPQLFIRRAIRIGFFIPNGFG